MGLISFVVRRIVGSIPTLVGLIIVTFALVNFLPGDPLSRVLGEQAADDPLIVQQYEERWGLDKSVPERLGVYVGNLAQGDLGESTTTQRPVADDLRQRLPATFELGLAALLIGVLVGGVLGIVAALQSGTVIDHTIRLVAVVGSAMPVFWLGLVALQLFYVRWGILPGPEGRLGLGSQPPPGVTGFYTVDALLAGDWSTFVDAGRHLVLPAMVLASFLIGLISRTVRASLLEVIHSEYLANPRAKGLPERRVLFMHALPNALTPTVTAIGLALGGLLAGAVLTETVFAWPGIGRYSADAAAGLDYQAVMGVTLLAGTIYILTNILVDVVYAAIDPRVRVTGR